MPSSRLFCTLPRRVCGGPNHELRNMHLPSCLHCPNSNIRSYNHNHNQNHNHNLPSRYMSGHMSFWHCSNVHNNIYHHWFPVSQVLVRGHPNIARGDTARAVDVPPSQLSDDGVSHRHRVDDRV